MVHRSNLAGTASATFSDDGAHRFTLERTWGSARPLGFVALNPSVADHETDDPSIRREVGFARREGAGGIVAANLSSFRATDPGVLYAAIRITGADASLGNLFPDEDVVYDALARCGVVVAAFGGFAGAPKYVRAILIARARQMRKHLAARGIALHCLGTTADGWPRHPLYLRSYAPLVAWDWPSPTTEVP